MKPFSRSDSKYLYAWIDCADGVRRQKSTGETEPKKAQIAACKMQEAEDKQREFREANKVTCRQIALNWVYSLKGINPDTTVTNYTNATNITLEALDKFADLPPECLTEEAVQGVRQFIFRHYAGNTALVRGCFAKRLLRRLLRAGGKPLEWLEDFKVTVQSDGNVSPREVYSYEDIEALRRGAEDDPNLLALVNFGENLGGRISDILSIRVKNYKNQTGLLRYWNSKGKVWCRVWLLPHNQRYVESRIEELKGADGPLIPGFTSAQDADVLFGLLLVRAGIRTEADIVERHYGTEKVSLDEPNRKMRTTYHHTFHAFRNTLISRLASVGTPLHVIMDIVGHKDARTTRRYMKVFDDDKAAALFLFGSQGKGYWQHMADKAKQALLRASGDAPAMPTSSAPTAQMPAPSAACFGVSWMGVNVSTEVPVDFAPMATPPGFNPGNVASAEAKHYETLMLTAAQPWPGPKG